MAAIRQRVPFRFSEGEEQEDRILDEQEQEAVIDRLREKSASSNVVYRGGLQTAIALSFFLHVLYILRSPTHSPLAVVFPEAPSGPPIPLAPLFALLQVAVHCNLSLNVLPPTHRIRQIVHARSLPPSLRPPIPLSHPATLLAPAIAPVYALLLGQGRADVLWWITTGALTTIVFLAMKWMKEEEEEITGLEKLRYTARGA
ncbi:hypothetical protein BC628DRAFT_1412417 [Trametes gibbosa]|nr:hypothetical protein BC628DRAFT_1412417 [Trametes gibbosa]